MDRSQCIDLYCSAWNEPHHDKRVAILRRVATLDVSYIDPTVDLCGIEMPMWHVDLVAAKYPGSTIARTTAIDSVGPYARFGWRKILSDGKALPDSADIVRFTSDGKLLQVIGFFGPLRDC